MRHKEQRCALFSKARNPVVTALLKKHVPHREGLIHDQNIGPHGRRCSKAEPALHAARVGAYGIVKIFAKVGERFDVSEEPRQLLVLNTREPQRMGGVLPASKGRIKSDPQLEKRRDLPAHFDVPGSGARDAGDHLEQRALTRAIFANDPQRLPGCDLKINILQYPAHVVLCTQAQPLCRPTPFLLIETVALGDASQGERPRRNRDWQVTAHRSCPDPT